MNCSLFWVLKRFHEDGGGEGGSKSTFIKNQADVCINNPRFHDYFLSCSHHGQ